MAHNTGRDAVPNLQQLKLAWILSQVPLNATHDEFQDIKAKVGPLFDAAMESERAKALRAAARDLSWYGAQGNLVHPDTAWAGVQACITGINNKADELDGGDSDDGK